MIKIDDIFQDLNGTRIHNYTHEDLLTTPCFFSNDLKNYHFQTILTLRCEYWPYIINLHEDVEFYELDESFYYQNQDTCVHLHPRLIIFLMVCLSFVNYFGHYRCDNIQQSVETAIRERANSKSAIDQYLRYRSYFLCPELHPYLSDDDKTLYEIIGDDIEFEQFTIQLQPFSNELSLL